MNLDAIRKKANDVIALYNPQGLVPFPYMEMAEGIDELEIVFGLKMSDRVSGAIFLEDGSNKFIIAINSNGRSEARQYFTVGHELGHFFLHREWLLEHPNKGIIDYSDNLEGQSMLLRPDVPVLDAELIKKEREANNFAAELLMPSEKVQQYWRASGDIDETAAAFNVSRVAMAIRLERLGLS